MANYTLNINFGKDILTVVGDSTTSIYNKIETDANTHSLSLSYNEVNGMSVSDISIQTGGSDCKALSASCTLMALSCNKKMYEPGHISFKIELDSVFFKVGENETLYSLLNLIFKSAFVTLTKSDGDDSSEIATNYCICKYNLRQQFDPTSTSSETSLPETSIYDLNKNKANGYFNIEIDAFSPDYLLTKAKSSKAYTGKRLFEDIIMPVYKTYKKSKTEDVSVLVNSFWPKQLMNLIDFENIDSTKKYHVRMNFNKLRYYPKGIDDDSEYEYIHPYLVQYDESAFDFIVRVLNRCGEFFYFEKGSFVFGWIRPDLLANTFNSDEHVMTTSLENARNKYVKAQEDVAAAEQAHIDATKAREKAQDDYDKAQSEEEKEDKLKTLEDAKKDEKDAIDDEKTKKENEIAAENALKEAEASAVGIASGDDDETKKQKKEQAKLGYNVYHNRNYTNQLGTDATIQITRYDSAETDSCLAEDNDIELVSYNYTIAKDEKNGFTDVKELNAGDKIFKRYNDKTFGSDEDLFIMPHKDIYINSAAEFPWNDFFGTFMNCFNDGDLGSMLSSLVWSEGVGLTAKGEFFLTAKQGYEKIYNQGKYLEERKDTSDKNIKEGRRAYSTGVDHLSSDNLLIFNNDFYQEITDGIIAEESGRLKLELGINYYSLFLGSIIQFNSQKYLVVAIHDECKKEDSKNISTCHVEAIPYLPAGLSKLYPPMVNNNVFYRKSKGTQRAFITVNTDPLRMNRYRVRYSWQDPNDDSSPWIRMALPMAGDSRGFNFVPDIGDEAIIDFENGNIEKPFIVGMVYNASHMPDKGFSSKGAATRSITSGNGHSIIFSDPKNGTDAMKAFSPAWGFISSIVPIKYLGGPGGIKDKDGNFGEANDLFCHAVGGIELADSIGFYSISMSTNRRAISIDSPIGKVEINAFTGINISAPLGNINIEGKNINIKAGNNLTLESGLNLEPYAGGDSHLERVKDTFKTFGLSLLSRFTPIDMNLVRTIFEAFLRPVGGRLLLKSHLNLCLEAGDSYVNTVSNEDDYVHYKKIYDELKQLELVYDAWCTMYPDAKDVTNTFNSIQSLVNQISVVADKTEVENALVHLKDGTKLDASKFSNQGTLNIVDQINECIPILKDIKEKYDTAGSNMDSIKKLLKELNVSDNVSEFVKTNCTQNWAQNWAACYDTVDIDDGTKKLGFTQNKISALVPATTEATLKNKRALFYEAFHGWYMSDIDPDNNIQIKLDTLWGRFPETSAGGTGPKQNPVTDKDDWNECISHIKKAAPNLGQPVIKRKLAAIGKAVGETFMGCWGLKGFNTDYSHQQIHKGKILYSSGDQSFTYSLNNDKPELYSSNSLITIQQIHELMEDL